MASRREFLEDRNHRIRFVFTPKHSSWLNQIEIVFGIVHRRVQFITLRRRRDETLRELAARPRSAWRKIELEGVSRIYKTPRILDELVTLKEQIAGRLL